MELFCPICKRVLMMEHKIKYVDYYCHPPAKDHHYSERIKDEQMLRMKIRLSDPGVPRIYLHIHFDDGFSEIWTRPNEVDRIRIQHVFEPDFSNMEILKSKLRTYLVFS